MSARAAGARYGASPWGLSAGVSAVIRVREA